MKPSGRGRYTMAHITLSLLAQCKDDGEGTTGVGPVRVVPKPSQTPAQRPVPTCGADFATPIG